MNAEPRRASRIRRWILTAAIGVRLLGRFTTEMFVSNLAQARLVLSRPLRVYPHRVRFRTRLRTPSARILLGTLVSMTPGTLTCDLDGDALEIHVLGVDSDTDVVEHIRERFESLLERIEAIR